VRRLGTAHILNDVLRVSVVGNSGSGKTTVAAAIGGLGARTFSDHERAPLP
jgi:ABC-type glutathione transport system ATPase component